jgi:putative ABC transport system permease protein
VSAATGIVEGVATLPEHPGEYLRILGVDAFTSPRFLTFQLSEQPKEFDFEQWLATPNGIAMSRTTAERLGVSRGDSLKALVNGDVATLKILSILNVADAGGADSRFAVMDIGWAQELLGRQGRLSAILVLLKNPNEMQAAADAINATLPQSIRAQPPRQRSSQLQRMVSAFQLNLTALSMVSLLVGVFLVYNTVSASVTRRRREIGMLRAIGATRNEVRALFLGEACVYGVLGIAFGCLGGLALSPLLAQTVERTISSLYVLVTIGELAPSPTQFLTAAIFGVGAVLVGAWIPANDASQVDPAREVSLGAHTHEEATKLTPFNIAAAISLVLAIASAALALLVTPPAAFAAAFFVLLAWALLSPLGIRLFGRVASASTPVSAVLTRLAADRFCRAIRRNAITVAALCAAIAMTVSLTVMIGSFRRTVIEWINGVVVADVLIAPSANEIIGLGSSIPEGLLEALRRDPNVASVDTFREERVLVSADGSSEKPAILAVAGGTYRGNLRFRSGNSEQIGKALIAGDAVAVSEPFAHKWKSKEGDILSIRSPSGIVRLPIAGIYPDYARDEGTILMSRVAFDRAWKEPGVQSLAVYLRNIDDLPRFTERIQGAWSKEGQLSIYSNRALRERVLEVFDQTFAVTALLRMIAIGVAVIGIFLSISTLVLERERETGTLRAIGASFLQIVQLTVLEATYIGALAGIIGLFAGCMLAVVLTEVVNPAFFGWSITIYWPWAALLTTPFWIIVTAAFAALLPARRGAAVNIAQAVREE